MTDSEQRLRQAVMNDPEVQAALSRLSCVIPKEWLDLLVAFSGGNYRRFRWAGHNCPLCGQEALEDAWPPNYTGCSFIGTVFREWGSVKCICVPCQVAFRVGWNGDESAERTCSETVPLKEHAGKLLTLHDVYREDHRSEHGEYPREAYL